MAAALNIHQFSGKILDKTVCFQSLKLQDQLLLWIGLEKEPCFKELSMAMCTPYEKSPTPIRLLGDPSSSTSSNMASRLSKRCQKPVFVSFNVPESSQEIFTKIEEYLMEEMKLNPTCFWNAS